VTYFFASSGGMTEDVQNGFPGSEPEPWLRGVLDPYDQGPQHRWRVSMSFASASSRLGGLVRGSLQGIEVLKRGYSPRILSASILGSKGTTKISGPELAASLGLYGTWAYFSVQGPHGIHREPDLSHYSPPTGVPPAKPAASPQATPPPGPQGGSPAGQTPRAPSTGSGGAPAAASRSIGGGTPSL